MKDAHTLKNSSRCHQTVKVMSFLEGELKKSERQNFVAHLSECSHCSDAVKALRTDFDLIEDLLPNLSHEFDQQEQINYEVRELVDIFIKRNTPKIEKDGILKRFAGSLGFKNILSDLSVNMK